MAKGSDLPPAPWPGGTALPTAARAMHYKLRVHEHHGQHPPRRAPLPARGAGLHNTPPPPPPAVGLCVNIGTLSPDWVQFMESAAGYAVSNGRPWVLDPVAISASKFRMESGLRLAGIRPCVIRGNASEILALSNAALGDTTGADSSHDSGDALEGAKKLSKKSGAIVPVSGAVDVVTDGERVVGVVNGVAMMQQITATGCAVTALIAAFVAFAVFVVAGELGWKWSLLPSECI